MMFQKRLMEKPPAFGDGQVGLLNQIINCGLGKSCGNGEIPPIIPSNLLRNKGQGRAQVTS
jgi:hypothetical protein